MKILQINAVYGYKSTGLIAKDIAEKIAKAGNTSYTLCMSSDNTEYNNIILAKSTLEEKVHALLTRLIGRQGCWSFISTKSIIKQIKNINPDIVHIHNLHSNFINLPMLMKYCAKYNKPVVVTLHDCWYFTGKCYHFEDTGCDRWKVGCGRCPKRMDDIPSLIFDSSRQTFKKKLESFRSIKNLHIVGCSHWITQLAKQSPIFKNADFHTIYNGIDTAIFTPKETNQADKSKFIIMAMANKWFLTENSILRERLTEELSGDCQINVIGCTKNQMELSTASEKIRYYGYISSRKELANFYREADVFLNITFIDTLPTVNMEAICCGTPVITYQSGGSPELVTEGKTGYIVPQNDIEGIISSITKIKSGTLDISECARIGIRDFDKSICYEKYINLYNNII